MTADLIQSRGVALVIAAPSGAGKTSLAREMVRRRQDVSFALSATTRAARTGERNDEDYRFVDDAEFSRLVEREELLEWADVHGRRYGTLRSSVEAALDAGRTVMLDIDVQGARQVRARLADAVLVFVLPPSAEELARRLTGRASESVEQRRERLMTARQELAAVSEFDYVIVNDDFEQAVAALDAVVTAENHRAVRMVNVDNQAAAMVDALNVVLERDR